MTQALIPIADGSEELECVAIIDLLRRADIDVTVASIGTSRQITASRGVMLVADRLITEVAQNQWDLIVLPGGMPGADNLNHSPILGEILKTHCDGEGWLGAICAAPAVVLGPQGLITGKKATCYPSFQEALAQYTDSVSLDKVVVDGRFITAQGPGTVIEFTLTIIELILGHEKRNRIASQLIT